MHGGLRKTTNVQINVLCKGPRGTRRSRSQERESSSSSSSSSSMDTATAPVPVSTHGAPDWDVPLVNSDPGRVGRALRVSRVPPLRAGTRARPRRPRSPAERDQRRAPGAAAAATSPLHSSAVPVSCKLAGNRSSVPKSGSAIRSTPRLCNCQQQETALAPTPQQYQQQQRHHQQQQQPEKARELPPCHRAIGNVSTTYLDPMAIEVSLRPALLPLAPLSVGTVRGQKQQDRCANISLSLYFVDWFGTDLPIQGWGGGDTAQDGS